MADKKLLMEYVLDDLGRIQSYHVLDKTPDVRYSDMENVVEREKTAREVAADVEKLGKPVVDVASRPPHVPVFGVRPDGSSAAWDYKAFPMGVIVSSSVEARTRAAKAIAESADHAKVMWAERGDEKGMVAEAQNIMMSRYEEMEDDGVNVWDHVPRHGSAGAEAIIVVVDVDKFPFQPDVDAMIGSLARLGRAADVHLLLLMSTTTRMPGELKANIGFRLLLGKSDAFESNRLFDDTVGTLLPDDPSYGVLWILGDEAVIRLLGTWPVVPSYDVAPADSPADPASNIAEVMDVDQNLEAFWRRDER